MKITLDLSDLVERGQLTPAEAERLRGLAVLNRSTTAINLLVGFGLVAVMAGLGAQMPTPMTAVFLGLILAAIGFGIRTAVPRSWDLLAQLCIVIGTASLCGGIVVFDEGSLRSILFGVAVLAVIGVVVRSGLMIAAAVLGVSAALGSGTGYQHAFYELSVMQPTLTIVVFAAIAAGCYFVSQNVSAAYERLALIAARVAVLNVNFGFWIGSLWGDRLPWLHTSLFDDPEKVNLDSRSFIPAGAFAIGWAIVLVAVGAWALRQHRMWVVNTVAVFGAIHFYTQWFERLGADPVAVLCAGVVTLVFALGMWRFNRQHMEPAPA